MDFQSKGIKCKVSEMEGATPYTDNVGGGKCSGALCCCCTIITCCESYCARHNLLITLILNIISLRMTDILWRDRLTTNQEFPPKVVCSDMSSILEVRDIKRSRGMVATRIRLPKVNQSVRPGSPLAR